MRNEPSLLYNHTTQSFTPLFTRISPKKGCHDTFYKPCHDTEHGPAATIATYNFMLILSIQKLPRNAVGEVAAGENIILAYFIHIGLDVLENIKETEFLNAE